MHHTGTVLAVLGALATSAVAQILPSPAGTAGCLRVGTKPVTPFVDIIDGQPQGWSIDYFALVFEEATVNYGLDYSCYTYSVYSDNAAVLQAAAQGSVDLAHAAITATSDREGSVDFSASFFSTGFRILTRVSGDTVNQLRFLLQIIGGLITNLALMLLMLSIGGGLLLLTLERASPGYRPTFRDGLIGILDACSVTATLLFGGAARLPTGFLARPVAYGCVGLSTLVTALITAFTAVLLFAADTATDGIQTEADLPGNVVLVPFGSTAATYFRTFRTKEVVPSITDALSQFRDGRGDAIVYDAPVLEHFAFAEYEASGVRDYVVVGPIFQPGSYAMGLSPNTTTNNREAINKAIYDLATSVQVTAIDDEYFGAEAENAAAEEEASQEQDPVALGDQIASIAIAAGFLAAVGVILYLIVVLPREFGLCGAHKKVGEWRQPPPKGGHAKDEHFWRLKRRQWEVAEESQNAISYPTNDIVWETYEAVTDIYMHLLLARQTGRLDVPVGSENVDPKDTEAPGSLNAQLEGLTAAGTNVPPPQAPMPPPMAAGSVAPGLQGYTGGQQ